MRIKYGKYGFDFGKNKEKEININKKFILISLLLISAFLALHIRVQNFDQLGNQLLALDPYTFFRMAEQIEEHGDILNNDTLRKYPLGYSTGGESKIISYGIYGIYKIGKLFDSNFSILKASQIYPAIAAFFSAAAFFIICYFLFKNALISLISTLLLYSNQGFLFRTISGFSDKEPFAVLFMFLTFLFLFKEKKNYLVYLLIGVFTALTSWSTNSHVFLIYPMAFLFIINVLKNDLNQKKVIGIFLCLLPSLILFGLFQKSYFALKTTDYLILFFSFFLSFVHLILKNQKFYKLPKKIPLPIFSLFLSLVLGLFFYFFIFGTNAIDLVLNLISGFANPFGQGTVSTSVSENQPSYFLNNILPTFQIVALQNFGFLNSLLNLFNFIYIGSVWLVYDLFKGFEKKERFAISGIYAYFMFHILFSKYSLTPNILTNTYFLVFPLLVIISVLFYAYLYYEDRLSDLKTLNENKLLLILWFFLTAVAARGGVRLIFFFIPSAILIFGYFIKKIIENEKFQKINYSKYYYLAIFLIFGFITITSVVNAYQIAPFYGPNVHIQWEQSFDWIRENTTEDSAFIHWWDYGYWIQAIGKRATVADGGHVQGQLANENIARNIFTAYNYSQLYEYLSLYGKPEYFYVVSDDVGKYYQMYRIGMTAAYYTTMNLQQNPIANVIPEVNTSLFDINYIYRPNSGGAVLWEDYIFDSVVFEAGKTYLTAILIPSNSLKQGLVGSPYAVIINPETNDQKIVPFKGLCNVKNICQDFGNNSLNGNLLIANDGLGFLIPEPIKNSLMSQLYIFNQNLEGISLAWESSSSLYDIQTFNTAAQNIRIYEFNYTILERLANQGIKFNS